MPSGPQVFFWPKSLVIGVFWFFIFCQFLSYVLKEMYIFKNFHIYWHKVCFLKMISSHLFDVYWICNDALLSIPNIGYLFVFACYSSVFWVVFHFHWFFHTINFCLCWASFLWIFYFIDFWFYIYYILKF